MTSKSPFIWLEWGSHWKWYEPASSVTSQVVIPVVPTSVASSTPGPLKWKLWMSD